jgi:hypothetical protein
MAATAWRASAAAMAPNPMGPLAGAAPSACCRAMQAPGLLCSTPKSACVLICLCRRLLLPLCPVVLLHNGMLKEAAGNWLARIPALCL